MQVQDLLQWWNLIYAAPLVVSIVWMLATVLGGAHGHAHHDIAHHIGGDTGHGLGHGHSDGGQGDTSHASAGHGHHVHGHDSSSDHDDSFGSRLAALLGLSQVPLSIIIGIFLLSWGAFGLMVNRVLASIGRFPLLYIWPSLGITFVVSAVITRTMAAIAARLIPETESFAFTRPELIGTQGHSVYTISANSGTANIHDQYGNVHRIQAKTGVDGQDLLPGTEIIVVDYDESDNKFVVRKSTI